MKGTAQIKDELNEIKFISSIIVTDITTRIRRLSDSLCSSIQGFQKTFKLALASELCSHDADNNRWNDSGANEESLAFQAASLASKLEEKLSTLLHVDVAALVQQRSDLQDQLLNARGEVALLLDKTHQLQNENKVKLEEMGEANSKNRLIIDQLERESDEMKELLAHNRVQIDALTLQSDSQSQLYEAKSNECDELRALLAQLERKNDLEQTIQRLQDEANAYALQRSDFERKLIAQVDANSLLEKENIELRGSNTSLLSQLGTQKVADNENIVIRIEMERLKELHKKEKRRLELLISDLEERLSNR